MNIINQINAFLADENGAETVEWVMVAAGIAVIALAIYGGTGTSTLKTAISNAMTKISGTITSM